MRVLFTTYAEKMHLYNLVPIAWALRTAGHEVRVASQPELTGAITEAGLTAVPVGTDNKVQQSIGRWGEAAMSHPEIDLAENRPERLTWDYVSGIYTVTVPFLYSVVNNDSMVDDLVAFSRQWRPDLVVWDMLSYPGSVAARACGAAHARMIAGLDILARMRFTFLDRMREQPPEWRDDPLAEWLTWTLARFGCDFDEEVVNGQWTIDPTPDRMRLPLDLNYLPVRHVAYNGPSVVADWIREPPRRPRVCLTLGVSEQSRTGGQTRSVTDLLAAVADLDVEVVATLDPADHPGRVGVPDNVRLAGYVPLHALLPSCSAIVHHGGSGTMSTALGLGVPQLVVPKYWESVERASRLEELGLAISVPAAELTPQALRDGLSRLLTEPAFREGAGRISDEIGAMPSPNEIVPVLEKLTSEHR
ncbi:glycosyl transferase family 28 [Actinoalloteichus sp. AHMU CJ021]|uniref:activator-dependent family glycosyltransferase n=1 Tax=Actinoalloteichus sp. AHMU CJ021 TaxID=2072503 RepID=UPI000CA03413|nr:glycosyl transferase family 28 [Actinoalloteichus sp. AHMU CJ021]